MSESSIENINTSPRITRPNTLTDRDIHTLVFNRLRRRSYSEYRGIECQSCNNLYTKLIAKKSKICYDCIVEALVNAHIFRQGFDFNSYATSEHRTTCIICLNDQLVGRKYLVCLDCLLQRLGDTQLLPFTERPDITATATALTDTTSSILNIGPEWISKSYFPCDGCGEDVIEQDRKERLCMECMLTYLKKSQHFKVEKRRSYNSLSSQQE